ncbi:SurA N-terminal domain-containing protein [Desulfobulbus alkaliphilus]|uniref:SurA N-terminal domain-containing protein n=1 Tax=Desulfobulbus alkaliphilus TaxID=869814 RepID=UPI0019628D6D|nr:SurA N-terminal domain-containing protein [Desulfobulbus alkaliphilus]MBM9537216.1 SurA N-terminal domain-containing protein [Desulfobulbus alkaliphilus]
MLDFIRRKAQSIFVQLIVVIIAIVFIFWGVGTNLGDSPNVLATVNGKEISYRAFQQKYDQTVDRYRQQFGDQLPPDFFTGIGLREQVLNQLIQEELLRQGGKRVGLAVSNETIQRTIGEMDIFQTNGAFDLTAYQHILERNRLTPAMFETGIGNELLADRVIQAVGSFAAVSEREVQDWLDFYAQEIRLAHARFSGEAFQSQVKVTDEALEAWYAANKHKFTLPPQYALQYLFFDSADDLREAPIDQAQIQAHYQEHLDRYFRPEQRRARHILFRVTEEDSPEMETAQRVQAESVLARIQQGESFQELARMYSEDATRDTGGDLGFFSRGRMVQPFEEAAFTMDAGEVRGPVRSVFGYHIIRLEEIVPERTQPLEEVEQELRAELERQRGKGMTFKRASDAYEAIMRTGSLDRYHAEGGQPLHRTDYFSRDQPPEDSVVSDPSFLQAAFSLRKGELSSIVATETGYAIIFVEDIKASVVPELAEVRGQVEEEYARSRSGEIAQAAAQEALNMLQETGVWPDNIERQESSFIQRIGPPDNVPDPVRQAAFAHIGVDIFPEQVLAVGSDFYIYEILESRRGPETFKSEYRQDMEQQLVAAQKNMLLSDWIAQLRSQAKIRINTDMLR